MGLDMYLNRFENRDKNNESIVQVGYWRKCNQIHGWFVNNVQSGIDDCNSYPVTMKDLKALKKVCSEVLKTKKHKLLPPMGGLFFGGYKIDDYYYEGIRDTIKIINDCIKEGYDDLEYQSSW